MRLTINFKGKQYNATNTEIMLRKVGTYWKKNAQAKLRRDNKNAGGTLKKSMKVEVFQDKDAMGVDITPSAPYWRFVDQGVRGAQSSPFKRQNKSPFRFKEKMPPRDAIREWMGVKGVRPRDKKGRFAAMTFDSLAYLIQRSIWRRGLRPTFFISDTGDRLTKKYGDQLAEALSKDYETALADWIKKNN